MLRSPAPLIGALGVETVTIIGLETLDGISLDGLEFASRAYIAFDDARNAPEGIAILRMRKTKRAKRLVEEILPIAAYVQAKYGPALRLSVTWHGGDQNYDALVKCCGVLVDRGEVRKRYYLEVTSSAHANDYLVRENINTTGGSFGPRLTVRDKKTGKIKSEPSGYSGGELEAELVAQVDGIVGKKRKKRYPSPTALLVQCSIPSVILDDEWEHVVSELSSDRDYSPFKEVYIYEPSGRRLSRIFAAPIRRRLRAPAPLTANVRRQSPSLNLKADHRGGG